MVRAELAAGPKDEFSSFLPAATTPLALFCLVSLVVVNALAVTSITNERDGQALDLLLVSDLSPREFVAGQTGRRDVGDQGDGRAAAGAVRLSLVVRSPRFREPRCSWLAAWS